MYAFSFCSMGIIGPVECHGVRGLDQVVPELVTGEDFGPTEPAASLWGAAVVRAVLAGVAGLLDEVPRHGDRVADPADVAQAGAEPLVVMGVVVDLERHDPVAEHIGVVDAGRGLPADRRRRHIA